jgi:hypothetical protein
MPAADLRGGQFDAAAGILAVVLLVVAFLLPGTPPKAGDSVAKITHFYVSKRSANLAADYLLGAGLVAFLWFLGTVRAYLRAAGESRVAAIAFAGGVAGIVLIACGAGVTNGLVFKVAAAGDATLVRALFDTAGSLFALSAFAFAVFIGGVACSAGRARSLPPWIVWSGTVLFVAAFGSGAALFATHGAFAGGDVYGLIDTLADLVWILALAVLMVSRRGAPLGQVGG